MAASIQLIIQRRQEISLCCARITKFLPFLFFHSFFFFYELREKISKRRNLCISKEGNIFISAVFSVIQLFSIIPSQILSLPYIIFSPKETRRNFILSNQPTNQRLDSLTFVYRHEQGVERKASFTIVTNLSTQAFPTRPGHRCRRFLAEESSFSLYC